MIHLTETSLSKIYQMIRALKMPISLHWQQIQPQTANSDTDTKEEEWHSYFPLVVSSPLLLPF